MNKKKLHHYWTKLRVIKPWYFLMLAAVFGVISVFALRANNLHMIELRNQVTQADKNNGDVEGALRELREYVHAHMNTNLSSGDNAIKPPIQLKYRYERLVKAEKERVASANEQIYSKAQAHCERLYPQSFSGGPRVPCIQDYVSSNGVKERQIEEGLYKFDFVSPAWSPDLAGLSLVLAISLAVLFLVWRGIEHWIRLQLTD